MTATDGNSGDFAPVRASDARGHDAVVGHVDQTCSAASTGRRAARALAEWSKRFRLTEAEFQLLWRLRAAPGEGIDQTTLANALAFSPAQISASVERLRAKGWVSASSATGDRRRHHWQLSATGRELLNNMLSDTALLRYPLAENSHLNSDGSRRREAAA
ncbi:MAG: MarR family winged helix-turn-helix transcriptional regulator [Planctomycetes bacterium]|nr:MarR family winged helix-turn-helix transcriptional regulator [Planctomycetota bacterium]